MNDQKDHPTTGESPIDPLLEPFTPGHVELDNRIFSSSHAPG